MRTKAFIRKKGKEKKKILLNATDGRNERKKRKKETKEMIRGKNKAKIKPSLQSHPSRVARLHDA